MNQFEWDPEKAKQNYKKHRVYFEEAATAHERKRHENENRKSP